LDRWDDLFDTTSVLMGAAGVNRTFIASHLVGLISLADSI
jgi:hypothetical protein